MDTIKLWNVETKTEIETLKGHSYSVNSVAFNANGTILASGSSDKTIKLWNVETKKKFQHSKDIVILWIQLHSTQMEQF